MSKSPLFEGFFGLTPTQKSILKNRTLWLQSSGYGIQYICWYNILLCWKKNFTLLLNLMGFLRGGYRFKNQIARGLHKKVGIRLRYTYTTHCKFPKNTEFIAVIAVSNIAVFGISTVTSNMSVVILFTIRLLEIMTSK